MAALAGSLALTAPAQPFRLPTANRALFEKDGEARFFAPTPGKPWTSGCFGCVRGDGWQMHEGIDIRCLQRDAQGEPTDPILATADGEVAYVNTRPSLSNYGNYVILRHGIQGLEVYSLYAHLRSVRAGLKPGQPVRAGEAIGVMGRTANTRSAIGKDRAHVHFELNLLLNERFEAWHKRREPQQRNDHGAWNGQNLVGLDPRALLVLQQSRGANFSLTTFVRGQTELCLVAVRVADFPWLRRYPALVCRNPTAEKEGVAGHEIALNYAGLPYEIIPRAASELKGKARVQLLRVNATEYQRAPCRKLVVQRNGQWTLGNAGERLVDLLTY